MGKKEMN
jgi:hypothetical protein